MSPQEFHYLHDRTFRVFVLLKRTIFVVFHTVLLVVALLLGWWFEVQPWEVKAAVMSALEHSPVSTAWLVVTFLGVSGGTILLGYWWLWNRAFATWSNHFLSRKSK